MSTLVCRLAGPLQGWSSEPRFNTVSTEDTPTWSGLLGLARAALGHGRDSDPATISWLRELSMAVRVDQPGRRHLDFHTINPLPDDYLRFVTVDQARGKPMARPVERKDLALVTLGELKNSGRALPWKTDGAFPTKITQRAYLHDAVFTWLVEGNTSDLHRLAHALTHPTWTLYLGRKSCPPASPLVLGLHLGDLTDAAQSVPALRPTMTQPESRPGSVPVSLVHITPPGPGNTPPGTPRLIQDNPISSHPQSGYATNTHYRSQITTPTLTGPNAWTSLLNWADEHLTRLYLEPLP